MEAGSSSLFADPGPVPLGTIPNGNDLLSEVNA